MLALHIKAIDDFDNYGSLTNGFSSFENNFDDLGKDFDSVQGYGIVNFGMIYMMIFFQIKRKLKRPLLMLLRCF